MRSADSVRLADAGSRHRGGNDVRTDLIQYVWVWRCVPRTGQPHVRAARFVRSVILTTMVIDARRPSAISWTAMYQRRRCTGVHVHACRTIEIKRRNRIFRVEPPKLLYFVGSRTWNKTTQNILASGGACMRDSSCQSTVRSNRHWGRLNDECSMICFKTEKFGAQLISQYGVVQCHCGVIRGYKLDKKLFTIRTDTS